MSVASNSYALDDYEEFDDLWSITALAPDESASFCRIVFASYSLEANGTDSVTEGGQTQSTLVFGDVGFECESESETAAVSVHHGRRDHLRRPILVGRDLGRDARPLEHRRSQRGRRYLRRLSGHGQRLQRGRSGGGK